MKLLPHWVLTDKFPAFYDSESKTVIEQTARIYGAMQELIKEYNSFVDSVNQHISDFENAAKKDYEVFTTELRQEFQDFIDVIELKIMSQDKEIQDAVDFLKNNLYSSIQKTVSDMIESGEFNEAVISALTDITEQLESLQLNIDTVAQTAKDNLDNAVLELSKNNRAVANVKFFGAVGDGVTDDYDAITAARNYAVDNNIPLYFPKGVYLISNYIAGWDGMVLIGDNQYTTELKMLDSVNASCVGFVQSTEKLQYFNMIIRGITFNQNSHTISPKFDAGAHAFRLIGFNRLFIDSCRFINASGYGLGLQGRPDNENAAYIGDQAFLWLTNCEFLNNGQTDPEVGNSDGVDIKLVKYAFIENCLAQNNSDSGIDVRAQRAIINNCICRSNGVHGVHVRTPSSCILSNILTESNANSGICLFVGAGYEGASREFICSLNNLLSFSDSTGLLIANEMGDYTYTVVIDVSKILTINATTGVCISNFSNAIIKLDDLQLNGNNTGNGIENSSPNVLINNARLNRFLIGYNGGDSASGVIASLMYNKATTPYSGVEPSILYPLYPLS